MAPPERIYGPRSLGLLPDGGRTQYVLCGEKIRLKYDNTVFVFRARYDSNIYRPIGESE